MAPVRGSRKRKNTEKKTDEPSGNCWDDLSKRVSGPMSPWKGCSSIESVLKISRKTFDYICSLVGKDLAEKTGSIVFSDGKHLSVSDQVAVALRRLSSGDSLVTIGEAFGMNQYTVSQVILRFIDSMVERAGHHLRWPSTDSEIAEIKLKFETIRGLPNCCGAIDCTHIIMCLPTSDPSTQVWLDQEKNHSMILQAIVDSDLRIRDVMAGCPGKMNEQSVLHSSRFFKLCGKGKRLNGKELEISKETKINEYLVGDAGFPLLPWLLTPYTGVDLSDSQSDFNRRLSETTTVAHRALVRLKEMWKIIDGVMWRPDKHRLPRIILVCCLLHNILIDVEDEVHESMAMPHQHDRGYRQQVCESVKTTTAALARDKLSSYLCDLH